MDSNDCSNFIQINEDALSFIGYMIDKYGNILFLDSDKPAKELLPEYHHDYFYFCLTKATRSLLASNILSKMRFREDAMVLVRTAYETYLLMANVIKDERFIVSSIIIRLKLSIGEAEYLKLNNGKKDFDKVIIKGTDKQFIYDMKVSSLSKKTYSKYDKYIHKEWYKYMSEFSHCDFITSGNYRTSDNKKYDVEPTKLYLDIHFSIMYITYLLLQSMHLEYNKYKIYVFNQIDKIEISELEALISKLKKCLNTILKDLDFSERSSELKDMILKRITEDISAYL